MDTEFHIRLYQPTDIECLAYVYTRSIHETCKDLYTKEELYNWAPLTIDMDWWHTKMAQERQTWVAEVNNEIVGFSSFVPSTVYLDWLYVLPEHQHKGIASELLRLSEEAAIALNQPTMYLIAARNAIPFYTHHGYIFNRYLMREYNNTPFRCTEYKKQLI